MTQQAVFGHMSLRVFGYRAHLFSRLPMTRNLELDLFQATPEDWDDLEVEQTVTESNGRRKTVTRYRMTGKSAPAQILAQYLELYVTDPSAGGPDALPQLLMRVQGT